MDNNIDPHYLITITNYKFGTLVQDSTPHYWDITNHLLKHGIEDNRDTNIHTLSIVDTMTSISLSQKK